MTTASRHQILDYSFDNGTLGYLAAISMAVALLFGFPPIARVLQLNVNGTFKGGARGTTQSLRAKSLSAALIAGQMALATILLSGAGVLVRSLLKVINANTGVRSPENVLVGFLALPADKYPSPATRLRYFDRLAAQLKTIPGIEQESLSSTIPVDSGNLRTFEIEGKPAPPDGGQSAQFLTAGPNYFHLMGTPPISGREFNDGDQTSAPPVAIVNETFAERFWPREQPLGRRLRAMDGAEWRTIVGVVPNIMQGDAIRQHFQPLIYVPFGQAAPASAFFLLRTAHPDQIAPAVRAEVQGLDRDVALENFGTLKASLGFQRDRMDLEHAEMGKHAAVAPIFAVIALLLAAIGLYAAIAHSISQRTKEIGARMAIGATAGDIRRMVFRDGMLPVAIGVILGLAASLGVNRILQSQLVGVSPYDPFTMTAAPLVLLAVALLGCHFPAQRATRIDPAVALRHD